MKLDNFKISPMSIISYVLFTIIFSYLVIGNLEIALTTTILSVWVFLMPKLKYQNSCYKDKIPKFIQKGDIINKLINFVFPIGLWLFYANSMKQNTFFENPTFGLLLIIAPIIPACIQYLILTKSDRPADWIGPFVMAILTYIAVAFVSGNINSVFHSVLPFIFNEPIIITNLWIALFEIFIIYAFYKIISFILPARTFVAFLTTFFFITVATIQNLHIATTGLTFKILDIFNFKQFLIVLKLLFVNQTPPIVLLVKSFVCIVVITLIVAFINKWSTIYDFKERAKGLIIGVLILGICVFGFVGVQNYAKQNNLTTHQGMISNFVSQIKERTQYDEKIQSFIDAQIIAEQQKETISQTEPVDDAWGI